jgi:uncharacterized Zn finger protein (UPF0148 family)
MTDNNRYQAAGFSSAERHSSDMSNFDKEAEREKLREKYGDDEESREATEQMSELLLKGATMTNAHCNDCGDPIFRYDGQEFCPTCQKPVDRNGNEAETSDGEETADTGENIEVAAPSDEATVQFGGDDSQAQQSAGSGQADQNAQSSHPAQTSGEEAERRESATEQTAGETRRAPSIDPAATRDPAATDSGHQSSASTPSADTAGQSATSDHLANAQVLLAQTVEQYAQRARDTESPREAQEYLEAAREAAETLDATGF